MKLIIPAYNIDWKPVVKSLTRFPAVVILKKEERKPKGKSAPVWREIFRAMTPSSEAVPYVHIGGSVAEIIGEMRRWIEDWKSMIGVSAVPPALFTRWWLQGAEPWKPGQQAKLYAIRAECTKLGFPAEFIVNAGVEIGEHSASWVWEFGAVCDHELNFSYPYIRTGTPKRGRVWIAEVKEKKELKATIAMSKVNGITMFFATDKDDYKEPPSWWQDLQWVYDGAETCQK
jgi:hypothetical protein